MSHYIGRCRSVYARIKVKERKIEKEAENNAGVSQLSRPIHNRFVEPSVRNLSGIQEFEYKKMQKTTRSKAGSVLIRVQTSALRKNK